MTDEMKPSNDKILGSFTIPAGIAGTGDAIRTRFNTEDGKFVVTSQEVIKPGETRKKGEP